MVNPEIINMSPANPAKNMEERPKMLYIFILFDITKINVPKKTRINPNIRCIINIIILVTVMELIIDLIIEK